VRIAAVGTAVSEHLYGTGRTLGQSRVPDGKGYAGQTGTMTKEYLKRSCQLMWNYTTSTIPYYQPPHTCRLKYAELKLVYRTDQPPEKISPDDASLLKFFATILKPVATAAPTDKYRKPAGVGPTIFSSESKAERDDAKVARKAELKMVDVNRADPAAVLVQPLSAEERKKRQVKPKVRSDGFDSDFIDLLEPARSTSALQDQLLAAAVVRTDPEFQNDSEDDESEYAIRK
jgi:hypothetical protein